MSKAKYVRIDDDYETKLEMIAYCTGCMKYKKEINRLVRRIKISIRDAVIADFGSSYTRAYNDGMHEVLAMIKELKKEVRHD